MKQANYLEAVKIKELNENENGEKCPNMKFFLVRIFLYLD